MHGGANQDNAIPRLGVDLAVGIYRSFAVAAAVELGIATVVYRGSVVVAAVELGIATVVYRGTAAVAAVELSVVIAVATGTVDNAETRTMDDWNQKIVQNNS